MARNVIYQHCRNGQTVSDTLVVFRKSPVECAEAIENLRKCGVEGDFIYEFTFEGDPGINKGDSLKESAIDCEYRVEIPPTQNPDNLAYWRSWATAQSRS